MKHVHDSLTPDDAREIGLAFKKSRFFEWLPGMRSVTLEDPLGRIGFGLKLGVPDAKSKMLHDWYGWQCSVSDEGIPLLTDAATLGCLTRIVREAWAPATLEFQYFSVGQMHRISMLAPWLLNPPAVMAPSEAKALLLALQGAEATSRE